MLCTFTVLIDSQALGEHTTNRLRLFGYYQACIADNRKPPDDLSQSHTL